MTKVYLASPWFNEEQSEREMRVKRKLRDLGCKVFSPRDEFVCKPNASYNARKETFRSNLSGISWSDVVFVITDGKDMGTIWEAGYAFGKKPIVYYCETLKECQSFNLMLAMSGNVVVSNLDEIEEAIKFAEEGRVVRYAGNIE